MNAYTTPHAHHSWAHHTVRALGGLLLAIALLAGLLLATTWGSLDNHARIAVAALTAVAAGAHLAIRRGRR